MVRKPVLLSLVCLTLAIACAPAQRTAGTVATAHDIIIRAGTVYDGSGGRGRVADIAIDADRITVIGDLSRARGRDEIDARGLAVTPGFINMLSWQTSTHLATGRGRVAL